MSKVKPPISRSNTILIVVAVVAVIGIIIFLARHKGTNPTPQTQNSVGTAPKDFHGIPPEGIGGDPDLNKEKNRWVAPASYTDMSVAEIIAINHDELSAVGKAMRSRWTSAAVDEATTDENKAVRVTGYIAHAKESGSEACNGKSDVYHDFHIWITPSPNDDKNQGIIVEATPFWKEQFPDWQLHTFEKLANEHAKVRVSGWLLWDEEHGDEVGKSRGSLWEIHPFTKFEVFIDGTWQNIARGLAFN